MGDALRAPGCSKDTNPLKVLGGAEVVYVGLIVNGHGGRQMDCIQCRLGLLDAPNMFREKRDASLTVAIRYLVSGSDAINRHSLVLSRTPNLRTLVCDTVCNHFVHLR